MKKLKVLFKLLAVTIVADATLMASSWALGAAGQTSEKSTWVDCGSPQAGSGKATCTGEVVGGIVKAWWKVNNGSWFTSGSYPKITIGCKTPRTVRFKADIVTPSGGGIIRTNVATTICGGGA